jgi:hypothetical protein
LVHILLVFVVQLEGCLFFAFVMSSLATNHNVDTGSLVKQLLEEHLHWFTFPWYLHFEVLYWMGVSDEVACTARDRMVRSKNKVHSWNRRKIWV